MPWLTDAADEVVEIRMQHRLAAAEGDDRGAERRPACRCAAASPRSAPAATPCRTRCSSRSRCCSGGSARSGRAAGARCASRPRTNSRNERTLRLIVRRRPQHQASTTPPGRSRRTCSPTFTEPVKIDPTGMKPQQLVPRDRGQARRRDAAAVAAVGRAAELARRDLRRQIGRHGRRRPREHAFVRRRGRIGVDLDQPLGRLELRVAQPQRQQIGDHPLAIRQASAARRRPRRPAACTGSSRSCAPPACADQNCRNSSR